MYTYIDTGKFIKRPDYAPARFFDAVRRAVQGRTDTDIARALHISSGFMSKLRNKLRPVGPNVLLRAHEVTGLPFKELRSLLLKEKRCN